VVLVLFVDSSIRAAQETDFFHRDTLHWRTFGRPAVAIVFSSGVILSLIFFTSPPFSDSSPLWVVIGTLQYFVVLGVVLTIAAGSLIVAARRTEDRTMRRFVRMLGFSLLGYILFFTIWIPLGYFGTNVENVGSDLFILVASYFLYQSVMSLSPLGRIDHSELISLAASASSTGIETQKT
ncbi:MAG TPA: hypothetical protein VIW22_06690, partial [Nitrososphaerales archaeon]